MVRRGIQLLLCLSLILVSGPLAPCKLVHALTMLSAQCSLKTPTLTVVKCTTLSWRSAADQDDDCHCDGSCWCSVHMSAQDAGGPSIDVPVVVALLTPATIDLMSVRGESSRPASCGLDPPIPISARSLPLLI